MLPFLNCFESFIDNVFRDKVYPAPGSILYCELGFGMADHSGVLLDSEQIVHLSGSGYIQTVSPECFLERLDGWNTAMSIYVSCSGKSTIGSRSVAKNALNMVGHSRDYNVLFENCHQFVSSCITRNLENTDSLLVKLKRTASEHLGADTWRVWER